MQRVTQHMWNNTTLMHAGLGFPESSCLITGKQLSAAAIDIYEFVSGSLRLPNAQHAQQRLPQPSLGWKMYRQRFEGEV